jgi:hypothetical protein
MTTVQRVTSILLESGYREIPKPLVIASLPFDFAATLIARERALDLIVVVDMDTENDERRLTQKIQSLARALDVMQSRRPVTLVLVGLQPSAATLETLSKTCRVLVVGVPTGESADQKLHDALAVLLPLPHLDEINALADWRTELNRQLPPKEKAGLIESLLPAAERGADAVEALFAAAIRSEVSLTPREANKSQEDEE